MMLTSEPVQFFFEFASPYSYIASLEVDKVAASAGRSVEWSPIELAAALARSKFRSR